MKLDWFDSCTKLFLGKRDMNDKRTIELVMNPNAVSWVWKYFRRYPTIIEEHNVVAVCSICHEHHAGNVNARSSLWEIKYGESHSTSKLENHLISKHREIWKGEISLKRKADDSNSSTDEYLDSKEEFLKWITNSYQPIDTCEDEDFRRFALSCKNGFTPQGRQSVVKQLLIKTAEIKEITKSMILGKKVGITTDLWTSGQ